MANNRIRILLVVAGVALAGFGGYLASRSVHERGMPSVVSDKVATIVNDERPIPAFSLKKPGGPFANGDLNGKWTFMFFGYTHCPDVCPVALSLLKDVRTRLVNSGNPPPQVIFVSVDPLRDTLDVLGQYIPAYDPAFIGATGSDEELAPLVKHFGVFYQRNRKGEAMNYTVDHSAGIYLVDPEGHLKAVFMPPVTADRMATEFRDITAK